MSASPLDLLKAIPRPTIERPFGIELWPYFDRAFTAIKGYHPQDFNFQPGTTPMSTMKETAALIITYYIVILGGRELMRNRPAFKLNGPFMVHNFYLTSISAILLALFAEELIPTVYNKGVFHAICEAEGGWTNRLVILYYVSRAVKMFVRALRSITDVCS
jgi:fatty acid elongase 2/fatty acid elongase 3